MKRILALILCAITMAIVLTACGGGDPSPEAKLTVVGAGS